MKIIFDLGHPAHFHLFKNAILLFKESGHQVHIVARQKDCLIDLLQKAGFEYIPVKCSGKGLVAKLIQNIIAFRIIHRLTKKNKADFIIGTSLVAPYVAMTTTARSVIFSEDDAKVIPIFKYFVYPFASYIAVPDSLNEFYGKKHLGYQGYHELAYLRPEHYQPDTSIKKELGVEENEKFFLVRLVSLTAHHDIGQKGISTEQAKQLVKKLTQHGKVFISAEKTVIPELEPFLLKTEVDRIFDVLSAADMVIGDSQSMTVESAVLGTPAIRCNTFVGRLSVLEELKNKYGLAEGFLPSDFDKMMQLIDQWLITDDLKAQWKEKREKMLSESVELANWIVDTLERLARNRN